ncbi:NAD(P)H-hydrate dehydratase [Moorena sp. SIO2C4]|uniref:NAD(P)H-hydrate dehydratase n=1 Tax=Moorena sp. SIO2C4 TaxID=2607824 RepID=UPI0013C1B1A1|nr:NAD(P)H-hydrate dehydratase [Moorena sp. SIO2C4]NEQ12575.1 NAD(P)H-hydrate dehydratase [Moorena sp. SIO3E2]NES44671.1 NAD(P)H-hydrate dehydratase [Moorena sp. SIO2C4]NES82957.1 NAD(P)H-hydrate dehydratase [Moorena sp. SIO2B7]
MQSQNRRELIEQVVVTAEQMREIEGRIFEAGMPVAALMEKVAGLITRSIQGLYPCAENRRVGVLVGPGHNGGDGLVVARELYLQGYEIHIYRPLSKLKELTDYHARYAVSLGIPFYDEIEALYECDLIIDGLFGFGLTRSLSGSIAEAVELLNQWSQPVVSIDLPSGLHTDTGEVLGIAVRATRTLCLGLWKLGFLQDQGLDYIGEAQLIDFGIPLKDIWSILGEPPDLLRVTETVAKQFLPLPRPKVTHKYQQGHLLLICGSKQYSGAAILAGLGARASGVGMLSMAVPESIKLLVVSHLPEAVVIGCPETTAGAIDLRSRYANGFLPELVLEKLNQPSGSDSGSYHTYNAIACGPGLTKDAKDIVQGVLAAQCPIVLDADGLNILAELITIPTLLKRRGQTVLTPHVGEFRRLFPDSAELLPDRVKAVQKASQLSRSVVLLKGARSAIANPRGSVWLIPESTPALARGGSGDVLTGLVGGLLAQPVLSEHPLEAIVATAAWWHAQAGILAAQERSELGVDGGTLAEFLMPVVRGKREEGVGNRQ